MAEINSSCKHQFYHQKKKKCIQKNKIIEQSMHVYVSNVSQTCPDVYPDQYVLRVHSHILQN